jgi:hypothetical protein
VGETGFPLVFFGACAVAGAILTGQRTGSAVAIVWIACLLGVALSVQAAVAHCRGHSFVVHIAGTVSFAALFVAGTLGVTPRSGVGLRARNFRDYCRVRFGLSRGRFCAFQ